MTNDKVIGKDINDISVVVQGGVSATTADVLRGLRTAFPNAEIVLSTWENSDLGGLDYDKVVLSPDPGAQMAYEAVGVYNNVNRQLISSAAGVNTATRSYILKTRTDIFIKSAAFLNCFGKYDGQAPYIFQNRLLICNYYTRNPRVQSVCFHPSDWLLFGRAEDVRLFYADFSLQTDEEAVWFKTRRKDSLLYENYLSRFTPEQYIFLSFLRRFQDIEIDCYYSSSPELRRLTEELYAKCFVVLDYRAELDIKFSKYDPNRYFEKYLLISHWQWHALYQRYCEDTASFRWMLYLLFSRLARFSYGLRQNTVALLDRLNLKEPLKQCLNGRKKSV